MRDIVCYLNGKVTSDDILTFVKNYFPNSISHVKENDNGVKKKYRPIRDYEPEVRHWKQTSGIIEIDPEDNVEEGLYYYHSNILLYEDIHEKKDCGYPDDEFNETTRLSLLQTIDTVDERRTMMMALVKFFGGWYTPEEFVTEFKEYKGEKMRKDNIISFDTGDKVRKGRQKMTVAYRNGDNYICILPIAELESKFRTCQVSGYELVLGW